MPLQSQKPAKSINAVSDPSSQLLKTRKQNLGLSHLFHFSRRPRSCCFRLFADSLPRKGSQYTDPFKNPRKVLCIIPPIYTSQIHRPMHSQHSQSTYDLTTMILPSFWTTCSYTNWDKGEPNNAKGNEDCVYTYAGKNKWNDDPCNMEMSYVCEKVRTETTLSRIFQFTTCHINKKIVLDLTLFDSLLISH